MKSEYLKLTLVFFAFLMINQITSQTCPEILDVCTCNASLDCYYSGSCLAKTCSTIVVEATCTADTKCIWNPNEAVKCQNKITVTPCDCNASTTCNVQNGQCVTRTCLEMKQTECAAATATCAWSTSALRCYPKKDCAGAADSAACGTSTLLPFCTFPTSGSCIPNCGSLKQNYCGTYSVCKWTSGNTCIPKCDQFNASAPNCGANTKCTYSTGLTNCLSQCTALTYVECLDTVSTSSPNFCLQNPKTQACLKDCKQVTKKEVCDKFNNCQWAGTDATDGNKCFQKDCTTLDTASNLCTDNTCVKNTVGANTVCTPNCSVLDTQDKCQVYSICNWGSNASSLCAVKCESITDQATCQAYKTGTAATNFCSWTNGLCISNCSTLPKEQCLSSTMCIANFDKTNANFQNCQTKCTSLTLAQCANYSTCTSTGNECYPIICDTFKNQSGCEANTNICVWTANPTAAVAGSEVPKCYPQCSLFMSYRKCTMDNGAAALCSWDGKCYQKDCSIFSTLAECTKGGIYCMWGSTANKCFNVCKERKEQNACQGSSLCAWANNGCHVKDCATITDSGVCNDAKMEHCLYTNSACSPKCDLLKNYLGLCIAGNNNGWCETLKSGECWNRASDLAVASSCNNDAATTSLNWPRNFKIGGACDRYDCDSTAKNANSAACTGNCLWDKTGTGSCSPKCLYIDDQTICGSTLISNKCAYYSTKCRTKDCTIYSNADCPTTDNCQADGASGCAPICSALNTEDLCTNQQNKNCIWNTNVCFPKDCSIYKTSTVCTADANNSTGCIWDAAASKCYPKCSTFDGKSNICNAHSTYCIWVGAKNKCYSRDCTKFTDTTSCTGNGICFWSDKCYPDCRLIDTDVVCWHKNHANFCKWDYALTSPGCYPINCPLFTDTAGCHTVKDPKTPANLLCEWDDNQSVGSKCQAYCEKYPNSNTCLTAKVANICNWSDNFNECYLKTCTFFQDATSCDKNRWCKFDTGTPNKCQPKCESITGTYKAEVCVAGYNDGLCEISNNNCYTNNCPNFKDSTTCGNHSTNCLFGTTSAKCEPMCENMNGNLKSLCATTAHTPYCILYSGDSTTCLRKDCNQFTDAITCQRNNNSATAGCIWDAAITTVGKKCVSFCEFYDGKSTACVSSGGYLHGDYCTYASLNNKCLNNKCYTFITNTQCNANRNCIFDSTRVAGSQCIPKCIGFNGTDNNGTICNAVKYDGTNGFCKGSSDGSKCYPIDCSLIKTDTICNGFSTCAWDATGLTCLPICSTMDDNQNACTTSTQHSTYCEYGNSKCLPKSCGAFISSDACGTQTTYCLWDSTYNQCIPKCSAITLDTNCNNFLKNGNYCKYLVNKCGLKDCTSLSVAVCESYGECVKNKDPTGANDIGCLPKCHTIPTASNTSFCNTFYHGNNCKLDGSLCYPQDCSLYTYSTPCGATNSLCAWAATANKCLPKCANMSTTLCLNYDNCMKGSTGSCTANCQKATSVTTTLNTSTELCGTQAECAFQTTCWVKNCSLVQSLCTTAITTFCTYSGSTCAIKCSLSPNGGVCGMFSTDCYNGATCLPKCQEMSEDKCAINSDFCSWQDGKCAPTSCSDYVADQNTCESNSTFCKWINSACVPKCNAYAGSNLCATTDAAIYCKYETTCKPYCHPLDTTKCAYYPSECTFSTICLPINCNQYTTTDLCNNNASATTSTVGCIIDSDGCKPNCEVLDATACALTNYATSCKTFSSGTYKCQYTSCDSLKTSDACNTFNHNCRWDSTNSKCILKCNGLATGATENCNLTTGCGPITSPASCGRTSCTGIPKVLCENTTYYPECIYISSGGGTCILADLRQFTTAATCGANYGLWNANASVAAAAACMPNCVALYDNVSFCGTDNTKNGYYTQCITNNGSNANSLCVPKCESNASQEACVRYNTHCKWAPNYSGGSCLPVCNNYYQSGITTAATGLSGTILQTTICTTNFAQKCSAFTNSSTCFAFGCLWFNNARCVVDVTNILTQAQCETDYGCTYAGTTCTCTCSNFIADQTTCEAKYPCTFVAGSPNTCT